MSKLELQMIVCSTPVLTGTSKFSATIRPGGPIKSVEEDGHGGYWVEVYTGAERRRHRIALANIKEVVYVRQAEDEAEDKGSKKK